MPTNLEDKSLEAASVPEVAGAPEVVDTTPGKSGSKRNKVLAGAAAGVAAVAAAAAGIAVARRRSAGADGAHLTSTSVLTEGAGAEIEATAASEGKKARKAAKKEEKKAKKAKEKAH
jgi:hypothetical protein